MSLSSGRGSAEDHSSKMRKELQKLVETSGVRFGKQAPAFDGRLSLGKKAYRNRHIASKLDSYARIVFPETFGVLIIMCWKLGVLNIMCWKLGVLNIMCLENKISLPADEARTYDL